MAKSKQRAVSILLFLAGILVLVAAWDLPESPSPEVK
jgi:predicted nucleic acid-binding Zn ribbon protein